jgi:hypothetical protein
MSFMSPSNSSTRAAGRTRLGAERRDRTTTSMLQTSAHIGTSGVPLIR